MKNNIAIIESDSVIVSMTRASFALAEAVTVSQTKTIIDVARAAEIYAKRQHLSESAISQATSVKVEAMRKLGEILKATPKNQGAKGLLGGGTRGTKKEPRVADAPTLEDLGLSKKESAVAQQLANLSEEAFEQVREGSVTIAKALAVVKAEKELPKPKAVVQPSAPVVEPESEAPPEYTELDAAQDQISELQADLVVARMGDATEEDKKQAAGLIAELQAEVKTLSATLAAVQLSRDSLMEERAQMLRQMKAQRAEIDRLKSKN